MAAIYLGREFKVKLQSNICWSKYEEASGSRPVSTGQCTSTCRRKRSGARSQLISVAQSPSCTKGVCESRAQWSKGNDVLAVESSSDLASTLLLQATANAGDAVACDGLST